jgi:acetoin utilization deacetylase AcuC-like enzyme
VLPVLRAYEPDLLLVSAGYDIHARDPLAGMHVSTTGCAALVERLASLEPIGARMVLAVEGGYHMNAFAACLDATVRVLARGEHLDAEPAPVKVDDGYEGDGAMTERGPAAVELVRAAQHRYWSI